MPKDDQRDNKPCSVCGKTLVYTRQHERLVHGLYKKDLGKKSTALVKVEPERSIEPENTIRVMKNAEVVTDGKRIGIVEWIR